MRWFICLLLLVFSSCRISDVSVAGEPVGGEYPEESPYMPKPYDFSEVRKQELRQWLEVHTRKEGLLGYVCLVSRDYFEPNRKEWVMVYDKELHCIGYVSGDGKTYRFIFNDYKEETNYIGTYEWEEALEHLYGVAEVADLSLCFYHATAPTVPLPLVTPIHYETVKKPAMDIPVKVKETPKGSSK
ncbi:MAG: hypothetical protein N2234_03165 [Planctomycetota bacterium]|nr:hypothetical protein [Planctomycetota bacterium]